VLGIDIGLLSRVVFAAGVALAALSGIIAAPVSSVYPGMGSQILIISFVVVVIGGIGSIKGALVAALLIGAAETFGIVLLPKLASMMVYLVMAAVFESTVYPVSIITSIFMAIIGVIWLLFVTRTTITIMAFIGVQILIGVVVNIGIVLVAHINQLRSTGMERMAAIVQAGRDRLRPILMTTLTASLGLLPLAAGDASLAVGGGGPSYAPMASSIMGGLLAGAVRSLVVVPAFYVWIDNGAERVKRFMRKTRVVDAPGPATSSTGP
jgi:predicted RND superfamily exporter protein